ncbi:MAG TPA: Asp-tRNA(Asn)/Glu-tRNA(Gln) amidotransferase subunit GatB [Candidatus Eisenbacteria bacterium]|nr:Asp-tRNA(Asn)/Glu-tRNA(Gln) amidotransferase subunit GatB [Candidatus Eisenbacteria bacterium]
MSASVASNAKDLAAELGWEAVIGLEVHIQLRTESKLFCACANRFGAEPNTLICPVCLGLPGSLPVLNARAVGFAVRLALALGADVHRRSIFARKNYFYPDMPKNYQISQYDEPIVTGGTLDIGERGAPRPVPIHRCHLEEDTGKSFHPERQGDRRETRVDFNRAGVPLIEMVSEPALASADEAYRYLTRLRQLVRVLGITDGDMEKGSLRCDANVSLRRPGETTLGTKAEIKNLNSIRAVERGIQAEIRRQAKILGGGGRVEQCTLLYDVDHDVLQVMRTKEFAHDYRYFPEPDLPPLEVSEAEIDAERRGMPELPAERVERFEKKLGLPAYDADVLAADYEVADYFERVVAGGAEAKAASNWVMGEMARASKERGWSVEQFAAVVAPERLAALAQLAKRGLVSGNLAKEVFEAMLEDPGDPEAIARARGLVQESDPSALRPLVEKILAAHPGPAEEFRSGKEKAFGFLLGQLMRATEGKANPQVARDLLREALEKTGSP